MINKEQMVLDTINTMLKNSEPIRYDELNKVIPEISKNALSDVEKDNPKIGIRLLDYSQPEKGWAISTLSIIASITDVLIDKRLAFKTDELGCITEAIWFEENE